MNLDASTYRQRVLLQLAIERQSLVLGLHDEKLLILGRSYGVGPGDCAAQIISDREVECVRLAALERRSNQRKIAWHSGSGLSSA